tara:strand:+ start:2289 stop:2399 length:111 start_codon:yes stop_codon:yes gene_type:complete
MNPMGRDSPRVPQPILIIIIIIIIIIIVASRDGTAP